MAQVRDALEAHVEAAQLRLRHPLREQPPEPRHAQHALRKHVGHAGLAREVGVDVDRVVVARGAREERERGAAHRRELQRGKFVADLDGVVAEGHRRFFLQWRQTMIVRSSATSSSRWLVAREVFTTNSSAPFFLS
ncbi:hypothetical protein FQZ97_1068260 [compost metagenome]